MPYRVRSTDVWFNAPGVVLAYQPIVAPDAWTARANMANGGSARYFASDGTPPTWTRDGWYFSAAAVQYVKTGLVIGDGRQQGSGAAQFVISAASGTDEYVFGSRASTGWRYGVGPGLANKDAWGNGVAVGDSAVRTTNGNLAFAGTRTYRDGVPTSNVIGSSSNTTTLDVWIGQRNQDGSPTQGMTGYVRAVVISLVSLSDSAMSQACRQMAFCHVNPDWSVWGRRRRYYYAPSQAGFLAAWAAHSNSQIGTGTGT